MFNQHSMRFETVVLRRSHRSGPTVGWHALTALRKGVGSCERGAFPLTTPFGPWDVTATLFSALGIDPATHYQDALGRPYALSEGQVMEAIYGS